ncbi:mitochondrial metalloendopeptidase OMA1 [Striga asiatica]|uniref:Mitochondrial metalloendopeptidase OMA1 n=1 Tax=Striga asiatica TaxID=4170 RepID=A0A5A7PAK4_STRAF|nr:mitochondrial metalloendopeptidase OMA1 [Striga asiatica]
MSLVLASVGQFWKRAMGFVLGRWLKTPPYFLSDIYTLMLVASSSLKHIPISNKLRLVFYPEKIAAKIGILIKYYNPHLRIVREAATLDPDIPEATYLLRLLVKLVRALSDGLRLQRDCRVSVTYVDREKVVRGRCEQVVAPRYGKKENYQDCVDNKIWDLKYDTEHLEGLNWNLTVVEAGKPKLYYIDNGQIVIHTATLYGPGDEELAADLAHEVGHGVAMHADGGNPWLTFWALIGLIPCTSGFWFGAIFVRLCGFTLYSLRRMELEAYYIGLMLMASAGYDPRLVPPFIQELQSICHKYYMDTTHPTPGRIAEMLSQDTVMDRALKIYEQVQAGHEIPSFIERRKRVLCGPIFSPFSVQQLFFPHVD